MTTKYTVKRCDAFGFAQTLRNAITLFHPEDYADANVFYLHSSSTDEPKSFSKLNAPHKHHISTIDSLNPSTDNPTSKNIIFVELGVKTAKNIKTPVEYDDHEIVTTYSAFLTSERNSSTPAS